MASHNHILLFWVNITGFCFSSLLLVRSYSIQLKGSLLKEETACGIAECWKNHRLQTKKQITCGSFLRLQRCYWYAAFFKLHVSLHSIFRPYPHLLTSHSSRFRSHIHMVKVPPNDSNFVFWAFHNQCPLSASCSGCSLLDT